MTELPNSDLLTSDIERQYRQELALLQPVIARRLGLALENSRWNPERIDSVELLFDSNTDNGVFHPDGRIGIHTSLAQSGQRWHAMIHELLHSFSAGGSQSEYGRAKGWEEGIVEHLQRLICRNVLSEIGVEPDETAIFERENTWFFNPYLPPWERIRKAFGMDDPVVFYADLLPVRIVERDAYLYKKAMMLRKSDVLRIVSECKPLLNKNLSLSW
jgi:hypothetical protein